MMRALQIAALIPFILVFAPPAMADVTENDLIVAARALAFTDKPPKGELRVGIVYTANSPQSVKQADDLQKMMGAGLRVGGMTLKPVPVKLEDAASADVGMFFLTEGTGADGARLAAATRAKRVPCVTVDIAQVQSGACTMGVRSTPKVEILVNRAAAADSGIVFASVFRMMITEL